MSFFGRLFGGHHDARNAVAAEAAGDYAEAAKHWALAGDKEKVAEMHLLRAERAGDAASQVAAYRDALRWAPEGGAAHRSAATRLAGAILSRARAEGLATEPDRESVRQAARLSESAGDFLVAGDAWELCGDDDAAAKAFERGGHVDRMERALARDEKRARSARRLREAFEEYELHFSGGDRESARGALVRCVDLAEDKGEYRRLLGELDTRRLADGRVSLQLRQSGKLVVVLGREVSVLGRDAACDLTLRSGGVSRQHTEIVADAEGFRVRDAGSRNGTLLGGLPVAGELPLEGSGELGLGEDCLLGFTVSDGVLRLDIARGLDKGVVALVLRPGASASLHGVLGLKAALHFRDGRPYLEADAGRSLRLSAARIARGAVQLARRDLVTVDDLEVEIG